MRTVVRPVRFTADMPAMREFLVALGLVPRVEGRRGGWLDMVAGTGMVALHDAATSDTGGTPGETRLSFEADDLDHLAAVVRAAGIGEPSVYDEAYGRVMSLPDPRGGRLLLDERSDDDYGFRRHRPTRPPRMHVVPLLPADDRYPPFLGVLGLAPRHAVPAVLEGSGGVRLDATAARVGLAFETAEPLAAVASRLGTAGYPDAEVHGDILRVTDPDGQVVSCRPAPYRVRPAVPGDVAGLSALGERVVPATYRPIAGDAYVRRSLDAWWTPERKAESLRRTTTFVAEAGGVIIGTGNLGRTADAEPVVWALYVDPAWHGRGVGTALLAAVVDVVPAGAPRLVLEHLAGNERAARFYRRLGFRPLRVEADPDGWPDRVWLSLTLSA